ncbi:hypothetical protein [Salana multivorans]
MPDQHDDENNLDPQVSLVPLNDAGTVAVFAQSASAARAVVSRLRPELSSDNVALHLFNSSFDALGTAGTVATGASSAVTALPSLQGVVQLAPETMALLNSGHKLMQLSATGQQLGTVVDATGTVVAHARFVPLGATTTIATVAASLGPAIALAAIQFQLNRLETLLGEVKLVAQSLLAESRVQRWSDVEARIERIHRELSWAIEMGAAPDHMVDNLAADAVALHAFALASTELLSSRVQALSGRIRSKDKREKLEIMAQAIVRDCVDLSLAADAWLAVETLRSFHIQQSPESVAQRYGERVYRHALATADTWRAEAQRSLSDTQRLLSRLAAQDPHLLQRNERRSSALARQVADALSSALPDLEPPRLEPREGAPGVTADIAELILQEARWVLRPGSAVESLVGVSLNGEAGFRLETTGQQVLIATVSDFLRSGEATVLTDLLGEDAALVNAELDLSYDKPDDLVTRGKRRVAGTVSRVRGTTLRRSASPTESGTAAGLPDRGSKSAFTD